MTRFGSQTAIKHTRISVIFSVCLTSGIGSRWMGAVRYGRRSGRGCGDCRTEFRVERFDKTADGKDIAIVAGRVDGRDQRWPTPLEHLEVVDE